MAALLAKLLAAALVVASFGKLASVGAIVGGGAVLFFGRRALRPAAALCGGLAAGLGTRLALEAFAPGGHLPKGLMIASGAVLGAVLGLAVPRLAVMLSGALFAFVLAPALGRPFGIDRDVVILGVALLGGVLPGVFWHALPTTVPPVAGAALFTLGAWTLEGQSGMSPALFRLPVAWLALFAVVLAMGFAAARASEARAKAGAAKKAQKAREKEKKRRAAEEKERYARYLE